MFWIYIPPIIFIAGLIALVVILGKKSAAIKKKREVFAEKRNLKVPVKEGLTWHKKAWVYILRFLEGLIYYMRIGVKKSEAGLAGAMNKIKEKRSGKKISDISIGEERIRQLEFPDDNIRITKGETEIKETDQSAEFLQEVDFVHEEVVVRKKPEIIPKRIMPRVMPEDKVIEGALIHRIAENPKDVEAYREIGDYYLAIGNIKDAKESFKMVLKLRPRDLKAKSSLREIEMKVRLGS